jgi:hypothetical protein
MSLLDGDAHRERDIGHNDPVSRDDRPWKDPITR